MEHALSIRMRVHLCKCKITFSQTQRSFLYMYVTWKLTYKVLISEHTNSTNNLRKYVFMRESDKIYPFNVWNVVRGGAYVVFREKDICVQMKSNDDVLLFAVCWHVDTHCTGDDIRSQFPFVTNFCDFWFHTGHLSKWRKQK